MDVFWHPQLGGFPGGPISLSKPPEILLAALGLGYDAAYAKPIGLLDVLRAHDRDYAIGVMRGHVTNGFGNKDPHIAIQVMAACGVHHAAALRAIATPGVPMLAPVSGFHHAHYASGYGFCTFNGLLITIAKLRQEFPLPRVLIIDGDAHTGDGTDDILARRGASAFSGVVNLTNLGTANWLRSIEGALREEWDLILYQAGADAHKDDPFGAGYLDDDEWRERDELVFVSAAKAGIPIVWNLAGGYNGLKTIELHTSTARTAMLGANARRRLDAAPATILEPVQETPAEPTGALADDVGDEGRAPQG